MEPEEFRRLQDEYERVSQLNESQQRLEIQLLRECDPAMACQIESLIATDFDNEDVPAQLASVVVSAFGQTGRRNSVRELRELSNILETGIDGSFRFKNFRLVECLSINSICATYRAFDEEAERPVALVVALPRISSEQIARASFLGKAKLVAKSFHPNLASILSIEDCTGELAAYSRQWIHGEDLASWAKKKVALELNQVLTIGIDIASALKEIHRKGVIHRDIKPTNIIVKEAEELSATVTDYGTLALAANPENAMQGEVGTPVFMAPELLAGDPASPSSDLFSLGVVLQWLSTGTVSTSFLLKSRIQDPKEDSFSKLVSCLLLQNPLERPNSSETHNWLTGILTGEDRPQGGTVRTVFFRDTSRRRFLANSVGLGATTISCLALGRLSGEAVLRARKHQAPIYIPPGKADQEFSIAFTYDDQSGIASTSKVGLRHVPSGQNPMDDTYFFFPESQSTWGEITLEPFHIPGTIFETGIISLNVAFNGEPTDSRIELWWKTNDQNGFERILELKNEYKGYNKQFAVASLPSRRLKDSKLLQLKIRLWSRNGVDHPGAMFSSSKRSHAVNISLWKESNQ